MWAFFSLTECHAPLVLLQNPMWHDVQLQMVNISWTPLDIPSNQNYTLRVTSMNTQPQVYPLPPSFMVFKAPEGAPPCEVYNFSVTTTYVGGSYVGATYTGDDCCIVSQVVSRMLPSLPDKMMLESSLSYSLERQSSEAIIMTISLSVSNSHLYYLSVLFYIIIL